MSVPGSVPGYKFIRAEHPSSIKHGGVCIYFTESLPLRLYNVSYCNKCMSFEIMISNKLYIINVSIYG